ncbi:predicted metal-dependent hydrolase [Vibrio ponticus]|nr:predicted metal-dependent hydrolase [Vibrio ponticus]
MTVTPTITQFCHQTWQLTAQIQLSQTSGDVVYVVTDKTPFHQLAIFGLIILLTEVHLR